MHLTEGLHSECVSTRGVFSQQDIIVTQTCLCRYARDCNWPEVQYAIKVWSCWPKLPSSAAACK